MVNVLALGVMYIVIYCFVIFSFELAKAQGINPGIILLMWGAEIVYWTVFEAYVEQTYLSVAEYVGTGFMALGYIVFLGFAEAQDAHERHHLAIWVSVFFVLMTSIAFFINKILVVLYNPASEQNKA